MVTTDYLVQAANFFEQILYPDSEFQPELIILASEQDSFGETKS
jgi:hypothetical protein